MSGDKFAPCIEIVADTRRRWSREEKLSIVEEASGASVNISAVARRHGIKPVLLYRWRKEFTAEEAVPISLIPVVIDAREKGRQPVTETSGVTAIIEIVLANGRSLKVPSDVDAATLERLISALDT